MNLYGLLKTLHVLSVVIWIGGVTALWTLMLRLGRESNRTRVAELLPFVNAFGQRVAGPAAGVVLITGIAMVVIAKIGGPLWVQLGFAGIVLAIALGATIVRKAWAALGSAASVQGADAQFIAALGRAKTVTWIYVLLMAAVIAVMVLKPTL